MDKIIIGIDPSLNSTAITIFKDNEFQIFNYTNKKPNYKWIKEVNDCISFRFHQIEDKEESDENNYSNVEIQKFKNYNDITDKIVNDINSIVDRQTEIYIEGFSYSSAAGHLINLVEFSTLLKYKLIQNKLIDINIISPSTHKKESSDLVYTKDKKGVSRDENNKAGAMFDKKDMMITVVKAIKLFQYKNHYFDYICENCDRISEGKNLPKPFDDVNDSVLLVLQKIKK